MSTIEVGEAWEFQTSSGETRRVVTERLAEDGRTVVSRVLGTEAVIVASRDDMLGPTGVRQWRRLVPAN